MELKAGVSCRGSRDNLIEMPFAAGAGSVAPDARDKMAARSVDPCPDRCPADDRAALRQQVFDIRRAEREPTVRPNCASKDVAGEAAALQVRHLGRCFHSGCLNNTAVPDRLAMPHAAMRYSNQRKVRKCAVARWKGFR